MPVKITIRTLCLPRAMSLPEDHFPGSRAFLATRALPTLKLSNGSQMFGPSVLCRSFAVLQASAARPSMVVLKSSWLKSAGYLRFESSLKLQFHSGGTYLYRSVPYGVYLGLVRAESPGTFFRENIKDRFSARQLP